MARHRRKQVTKGQVTGLLIVFVLLLVLAIALLIAAVFYNPTSTLPSDTDNTTTGISVGTTATTTTTTTVFTTSGTTAPVPQKRYVQPENAVWYLKLANDWNTLPADYDSTFTAVEYGGNLSGKLFDSRAVDALREMLAAGNAADPTFNLQPVSCYRSVALQKSLYDRQVKRQLQQGMSQEKAEEVAATIVKRPGQSEHNTGLAADIGGSGDYSLEQSFERTPAFKWLYENCAEYGFILRFPKNKENVTGVIYEPWHYRYVGKEVAKEIMSQGLCLEEYLEKTGQ
jgi:D-alanyl-D-alanine carboxypeptidase